MHTWRSARSGTAIATRRHLADHTVSHATDTAVGLDTGYNHDGPRTVASVHDHLPPGLPPDPFAGDPYDPTEAFDALEPGQPLDPHERMAVEEDLADLAVYEALLGHRGVRGLVIHCEDCHDEHFHDWDMLRANLLQLLADGTVRPHEPAYDPCPDSYVTWDYCRGFADATMNDASLYSDGLD